MTETYDRYKQAVEQALASLPLLEGGQARVTEADPVPPPEGAIPQPLRSAMRYSLTLPGKRLRPVLLLAGYALAADDWEAALPFACALEMIHTYSLIHDDLPALDNDALRRGQPTNHRVFGENMAILAGDGLLQLAYETMLEAPIASRYPQRALAAIREI
ncbi:MAG: polyprenyl synthetase family protein, partial [Eubacteriales bacterium]|nr:polyprenyl synthetase family protein [Eubacteriales bacterium]